MVITPQKFPDTFYRTQVGRTHVAPHRKGRIPNPLAPNQPQGQRASYYQGPEVSPQELALDFLKKLPHKERLALQEQAIQPKEPVGPLAMEELVRDYIRQRESRGAAVNTIRLCQTDLATFARFLMVEERDMTEMGFPLLQKYCAYLVEKRGYARVSVSRQLTHLKGFLVYLRRQGVLERSQLPAPRMFITKTPKSVPHHLNQQEVTRLIEAPDSITLYGIRDQAWLELLYGAGLRVTELVGLNVSDLELEYKTAFIRHGKGDR